MKEIIETPNGFESWSETHFDVVAHLIRTEDFDGSMSNIRHEQQGLGGLYELANDLTNEFEKKFEGKLWEGEYFDELEAFWEEKENEHFKEIHG